MRHDETVTVTLISDEEMYTEREAAQLLGIPQSTLHFWLEGGKRGGRLYTPVLRPQPIHRNVVTWGEFLEAAYLRHFRKDLGVKMADLRSFIMILRDRQGVPYPLATNTPWVGAGPSIVLEAQESADLDSDLWSVVRAQDGQILLLPAAEAFLETVEFDELGIGRRLRPRSHSEVVIDPTVRFGAASVAGISTRAIADLIRGGESFEAIAEDYGLSLDQIVDAWSYERPSAEAA